MMRSETGSHRGQRLHPLSLLFRIGASVRSLIIPGLVVLKPLEQKRNPRRRKRLLKRKRKGRKNLMISKRNWKGRGRRPRIWQR